MLTGVAHSAVCVPDVEEAVAWYRDVLGLDVLSPPYRMAGAAIERDMGELFDGDEPVVLKAAIVGVGSGSDRVLEVIEYPGRATGLSPRSLTDPGLSHIGLVCDDIAATRAELEAKGVRFLTAGVAGIAGLRTTWFADPYGVVFILMEKGDAGRPYYRQHA